MFKLKIQEDKLMKIGIIGAGNMGSALGRIWASQGHEVMLSYSRDRTKLDALAQSIGVNARAGTPVETTQFADVILLVVPWRAVQNAIASAGTMAGKTVISCITPIKSDFSGLEIGTTTSTAEEVAKLIPDAHVVEVLFPFAEILQSSSRQFGTDQPTQFYCGDNPDAKGSVAQLITEVGLSPLDVGGLTNARYLEPVGMLLVQLAYANRMGTNIGLKLINTGD
jgi:8-hydroxy-5-deazaflavin:NADPH oxidoreductase